MYYFGGVACFNTCIYLIVFRKDSLKLGQSQSLSTTTVIISVHMRVWRFKGIDKVGELTLDGYDWL